MIPKKHYLLTIFCSLTLVGHSQFDQNGLPPGFADQAIPDNIEEEEEKTPISKAAPKTDKKSLIPVNEDLTKEIRDKIETLPAGKYLSKPLTSQLYLRLTDGQHGEQALRLIREWEDNGAPPDITYNGEIQYKLGKGTPLVLVKPAHLSSVKFQEGEIIKDILLGDSTRWEVVPTYEGDGQYQRPYLVVKCSESGISTTLFVATNFRLYRLQLASSAIFDTPIVSFQFPPRPDLLRKNEEEEAKRLMLEEQRRYERELLEEQHRKEQLEKDEQIALLQELLEKQNAPQEAEVPKKTIIDNTKHIHLDHNNLDFNYKIKKKGAFKHEPLWMPKQVFNDGIRTYIVMPKVTQVTSAPILLNRFQGKNEMLNYRLVGDRYIVDQLFHEAVLLSGVGKNKQEVRILYGQ